METLGLTDDDLQTLEAAILSRPEAGPVMKGTAGLKEMVESLETGEPLEQRFTVRTVELDLNPLPCGGPAVRATRDMIGASQAVFAKLLGVSTVLVISWESGKRTPAPWARRLLDEVNRDPAHWLSLLTD